MSFSNQGTRDTELTVIVYKYWGIIPQHPDWGWNDYYEFHADSKLRNNSIIIYEKMMEHWNYAIKRYKQIFYNDYK